MAELRPFKGYRYSLVKHEDLGDLITPPYDMLDEARIESLYRKSPLNAVRIDQNRALPGDAANRDRHLRAARLFADWTASGALRADDAPSVYVYEQKFAVSRAGKKDNLVRSGVIVLVKLVDFSEGVVLPHEHTLSGPKIDRYEHLEATRLNVGQIFGLLSDDTGEVFGLIRAMKKGGECTGTAIDPDNVRHALYRCRDTTLIARLVQAARPGTILIADGHHRYETALKFSRDHADDPACAHVMMTLVSMADPGLVIRSFHRLIRKVKGEKTADMTHGLGECFSMEDLGTADISTVNSFLGSAAGPEMLYVDSQAQRAYGLTLSAGGRKFLQSAMPERSLLWKSLDMSKINLIAVNRVLGLPLDGLVLHDRIAYLNDAAAALEACRDAAAFYGGFFIRPVSIAAIHRIVRGGERMPQKSTNFYPKLYSGLVFNRVGEA